MTAWNVAFVVVGSVATAAVARWSARRALREEERELARLLLELNDAQQAVAREVHQLVDILGSEA